MGYPSFSDIIFVIVSLVVIVTNTCEVVHIYKKKKKNSYEVLLLSLSVSDAFFGLVNLVFLILRLTSSHSLTDVLRFLYTFSFLLSVLHLVTLALDRWVAVTFPLRHKVYWEVSHAKKTIALIWLVVGILNTGMFFDLLETTATENTSSEWVISPVISPSNTTTVINSTTIAGTSSSKVNFTSFTANATQFPATTTTTLATTTTAKPLLLTTVSAILISSDITLVILYTLVFYQIAKREKCSVNQPIENEREYESNTRQTKQNRNIKSSFFLCFLTTLTFILCTLRFTIQLTDDRRQWPDEYSLILLAMNSFLNTVIYFFYGKSIVCLSS